MSCASRSLIGSVDVVSLPVCFSFMQTGHFTQTCRLLCKKKTLSHTTTEKLMLPKKNAFLTILNGPYWQAFYWQGSWTMPSCSFRMLQYYTTIRQNRRIEQALPYIIRFHGLYCLLGTDPSLVNFPPYALAVIFNVTVLWLLVDLAKWSPYACIQVKITICG